MNPQELATEVESFIRECTGRITGIGAQQYHEEGKPQKFETMEFSALAEYYLEELRDVANYAAMTSIRLKRIGEEFNRRMEALELAGTVPELSEDERLISGRLADWQSTIGQWGEATFPKANLDTILSHLTEEVLELRGFDKPVIRQIMALINTFPRTQLDAEPSEAADVFILLLQYCHRAGITLEVAAMDKFAENRARFWGEANEFGHVNHVDSEQERTFEVPARFKTGQRVFVSIEPKDPTKK